MRSARSSSPPATTARSHRKTASHPGFVFSSPTGGTRSIPPSRTASTASNADDSVDRARRAHHAPSTYPVVGAFGFTSEASVEAAQWPSWPRGLRCVRTGPTSWAGAPVPGRKYRPDFRRGRRELDRSRSRCPRQQPCYAPGDMNGRIQKERCLHRPESGRCPVGKSPPDTSPHWDRGIVTSTSRSRLPRTVTCPGAERTPTWAVHRCGCGLSNSRVRTLVFRVSFCR
jgi:hypothetical protein